MSGGIYIGPGGQELHGDGKPVYHGTSQTNALSILKSGSMKTKTVEEFIARVQNMLVSAGKNRLTSGEQDLVRLAYDAGKAEAAGGLEW